MRRIICLICAISIIMSCFPVFAEEKIVFSEIIENETLQLPANESIVLKNGSVVIEFEDMEYESVMSAVDDDAASGGVALKVVAPKQLNDESTEKKVSIKTKFIVEKEATYYVWVRARNTGNNYDLTNLYIDSDNSGKFTMMTLQLKNTVGNYHWVKVASRLYSEGVNYFNIKYRATNAYYDKMIITSDSNYTPEGADADPNKEKEETEGVEANLNSIPIYPVKGEHPRLFFKAEDIPAIKEQIANTSFFASTYETNKKLAQKEIVGKLPEGKTEFGQFSNYPDIIRARAFMYAMGEVDAEFIKETIKECRDYVSTVTFATYNSTDGSRHMGNVMIAAACLYDWCYDLLTEEDKAHFCEALPKIAEQTEMGYPPTKRNYLLSHSIESLVYKDQLIPAVALYDELPYWFNIVGTILFDEILPFQKFQVESGTHSSGSSYTEARTSGAIYADKVFNALGYNESILGDSFKNLYYTWIYNRVPSGLWFKETDDYFWNKWYPDTRGTQYGMFFRTVGSLYDDPMLLYQGILDLEQNGYNIGLMEMLLYLGTEFDVSNATLPTELPLTRFTTYPLTTMVARTSWQNGYSAPTAMVYVNMRDMNIGDHQQADLGSFQLYYKGMLAIDSGFYEFNDHYYNYQTRSIAHNVMLVEDPNEIPYRDKYQPDGGQKGFYSFAALSDDFDTVLNALESGEAVAARVKATYAGPTELRPKFSYISGELSNTYTEKVEEYERSAVFINLEHEDYPAAFIVYDNIKSSNPDFKKKWILHAELEPQIDMETNTTVLTRTENGQNGKLVNKTLIPSPGKTEIALVGGEGKEWTVNGVNYPTSKIPTGIQADAGNWRIEVSPSLAAQEDRFLNAMYVCDADRELPELPMYREYGSLYTGVTVMDNMVIFSNTRDNIENSFTLSVRENGYDSVNCLLTDIKEGVWKISGNGMEKFVESKTGEYTLTFSASPGRYTVSPAPSTSKLTDEYSMIFDEEEDFGDFLIRKGTNLMYQPKPTKLIDGVPYMAVDGIITQLGVEIVSADGNTVTLKNGKDVLVLTADSNICTLNGAEVTLKNPPKMVSGEVYATVDEFTKFLSISDVKYDDYAKVLSFKVISQAPIEGVDMSKVVAPVHVDGSVADGSNTIENIYDRNLNTYYCTTQALGEVVYDLGDTYDVSKVLISLYNGHLRKSYIDVLISEDGENWRTAFSGTSSGKTQDLESYKVNDRGRYIKILHKGNDNGSVYRSIFELIVMKK